MKTFSYQTNPHQKQRNHKIPAATLQAVANFLGVSPSATLLDGRICDFDVELVYPNNSKIVIPKFSKAPTSGGEVYIDSAAYPNNFPMGIHLSVTLTI